MRETQRRDYPSFLCCVRAQRCDDGTHTRTAQPCSISSWEMASAITPSPSITAPNAWHVPGENQSGRAAVADGLKSSWFAETANWPNCEGLSSECRAC